MAEEQDIIHPPYTTDDRTYTTTNTSMSEKLTVVEGLNKLFPNWRDRGRIERLSYYNKYQAVIELADTFQIFTANNLAWLCQEYDVKVGKSHPSRNTIKKLLQYLRTDGLINERIVKTGYLKPAHVYYTHTATEEQVTNFTSMYEAYEEYYQERKKEQIELLKAKEHIKNEYKKKAKETDLEEIKEKHKKITLAMKLGVEEAKNELENLKRPPSTIPAPVIEPTPEERNEPEEQEEEKRDHPKLVKSDKQKHNEEVRKMLTSAKYNLSLLKDEREKSMLNARLNAIKEEYYSRLFDPDDQPPNYIELINFLFNELKKINLL